MNHFVVESLDRAADAYGDFATEVYTRYLQRCPASSELMADTDEIRRGRMLAEVLRLFLSDDTVSEREYLHFESTTHRGYGVEPDMYRHLFSALRDTVREALDTEWSADHAAAWERRESELLGELQGAASQD